MGRKVNSDKVVIKKNNEKNVPRYQNKLNIIIIQHNWQYYNIEGLFCLILLPKNRILPW